MRSFEEDDDEEEDEEEEEEDPCLDETRSFVVDLDGDLGSFFTVVSLGLSLGVSSPVRPRRISAADSGLLDVVVVVVVVVVGALFPVDVDDVFRSTTHSAPNMIFSRRVSLFGAAVIDDDDDGLGAGSVSFELEFVCCFCCTIDV